MDCKILHYLRKKQKIHIGVLNNHINYTFIDIITLHHYTIYKHHLKRQKTSKCETLLGYLLFEFNWHSLYIRVEKLGLLGFYFSFRSIWVFCQVKKDYKKNQGHLGLSESYNPTDPEWSQRFLKDLDRFGQVKS